MQRVAEVGQPGADRGVLPVDQPDELLPHGAAEVPDQVPGAGVAVADELPRAGAGAARPVEPDRLDVGLPALDRVVVAPQELRDLGAAASPCTRVHASSPDRPSMQVTSSWSPLTPRGRGASPNPASPR